jgi:hypothetical protein
MAFVKGDARRELNSGPSQMWNDASEPKVLKGHDFSRANKGFKDLRALAPEGRFCSSENIPRRLKPEPLERHVAARLKSCPFKAIALTFFHLCDCSGIQYGLLSPGPLQAGESRLNL